MLVTRTTALTTMTAPVWRVCSAFCRKPWGPSPNRGHEATRSAGCARALFAVPPIRAQKLRLDHVEDVCDRGIRR